MEEEDQAEARNDTDVTEQEGQEEGGVEEKDCTTQQWSQGE
jgi:hypothetical protein